jgi:hypothetical protein
MNNFEAVLIVTNDRVMRLQLLQTDRFSICFSAGLRFGVHSSLEAVRFRLPPPELFLLGSTGPGLSGGRRESETPAMYGANPISWMARTGFQFNESTSNI